MQSISLKLSAALDAELTQLAKSRSVSKSEVLRLALERYLRGEGVELSCADLASDLAGCVKGPRDLASNPKHLRGFGK